MSNWPFPSDRAGYSPARAQTMTPQAAWVIDHADHTPEQLEMAIKAQGDLVEFHGNYGRMEPAREALKVVRQLHAMRTPETVARLEQERGLA